MQLAQAALLLEGNKGRKHTRTRTQARTHAHTKASVLLCEKRVTGEQRLGANQRTAAVWSHRWKQKSDNQSAARIKVDQSNPLVWSCKLRNQTSAFYFAADFHLSASSTREENKNSVAPEEIFMPLAAG